jgi:dephospho-CoA kinase
MQRLMNRNGFSEDDARSRIRAQLTNDERARHATVVIDNSGTVEEARQRVTAALARGASSVSRG